MRAKATTEDVRIARVRRSIKRELSRRTRARESLIDFLHFVWWNPWDLIVGRHTRAICDALDQAIADYRRGVSTFLLIAVPFRHGKSDLVSRAFPPYFLATCSDMSPDVILTGYGQDLVEGYSADCHDIIRSKPFEVLFPDTQLERGRANVGSWSVTNSRSRVTAAGMGGALTGKGASLLNVDDYCKNRFEARSETYRNRAWDGFLDALSRRAPVSITLLTATPWHVDDVRGRPWRRCRKTRTSPGSRNYASPRGTWTRKRGNGTDPSCSKNAFRRSGIVNSIHPKGPLRPLCLIAIQRSKAGTGSRSIRSSFTIRPRTSRTRSAARMEHSSFQDIAGGGTWRRRRNRRRNRIRTGLAGSWDSSGKNRSGAKGFFFGRSKSGSPTWSRSARKHRNGTPGSSTR